MSSDNGENSRSGHQRDDIAKSFLVLQSKELDVRLKEAEVNRGDLNNQKEIALASIQAQVQDRRENRQIYDIESTKNKWFILLLLLIVFAFLLALIWLNQPEMAQKIIEIAVTGGLSAFGGYGFAKWQMRDFVPQEDSKE